MKDIITEPVVLRNEKRIKLLFEYDSKIIEKVKKIPGRRWSQTMKCWHVPDNKETIELLRSMGIFIDPTSKVIIQLDKSVQKALHEYHKYLIWKRLSSRTITSYTVAVKKFFLFYPDKIISEISNEDINNYIFYLVENRASGSMQNIVVSGLKLFFKKIVNKNINIHDIERPKRSKPLPKVIAKEDIEKMLSGISNLKHQTALLLIYALGLRRSELLNIHLKDINSKRMIVHIRNAKGKKDRVIPLSQKILDKIKKYYLAYKPGTYLIEGVKKGVPYTASSLQKVFHRNMDKVKPGNTFTLHCLRHSCATHLLESGTDIRYIQELLGHKSTRTTEIYTHVSVRSLRNIKDPTDDFDI